MQAIFESGSQNSGSKCKYRQTGFKKNVKVATGQRKHITQSTDNLQMEENL